MGITEEYGEEIMKDNNDFKKIIIIAITER